GDRDATSERALDRRVRGARRSGGRPRDGRDRSRRPRRIRRRCFRRLPLTAARPRTEVDTELRATHRRAPEACQHEARQDAATRGGRAAAGTLRAPDRRRGPPPPPRRRPRVPPPPARPAPPLRGAPVKNPLVALDVLAIQELLARYCVYLDRREFDT